jgi:N-dimethylarginine dimethylaminohydrolase
MSSFEKQVELIVRRARMRKKSGENGGRILDEAAKKGLATSWRVAGVSRAKSDALESFVRLPDRRRDPLPKLAQSSLAYNGHSMVGPLQRVLVGSPRSAGWNLPQRVSAWHDLGFHHAPDFEIAQAQHDALVRELKSAGAEVLELPPSDDLSLDAVYTHDASLSTDFGLVLMRPGKPNRVAEARHHESSCAPFGVPTFGAVTAPGTTEAGDIVWLNSKTLLVGQGYRTNRVGIHTLRDLLAPKGIDVLAAPLPYGSGPSACLHLMSLISLLDEETALVDLPWLAVETVELLKARGFRFVEIDYAERETLACNVLSLGGKRLLAIEENHSTNDRLRHAGFDVRTFPGSEICINGSGGPTCLTRPLLRG